MENVVTDEGYIYTAIFPEEVWKIIISNLSHNHNELLRCRLVCYGFKCLADEVLQENNSLWVPTFPADYDEFQGQVQGTRFSTAEQVTTFISEMEGNPTGTPFPNRTLIFATRQAILQNPLTDEVRTEIKEFYESFTTLVSHYGEEITSLVYFFIEMEDDAKFFSQLKAICNLPNLTKLAIYRKRWIFHSSPPGTAEMLEELKKGEGFQVPKKLTELQILGESGFLALAFIFSRLPQIMEFVTHLYVSFSWYCERFITPKASRDYQHLLHMPQLGRLKLWDPDKKLIEYFCRPASPNVGIPALKEISIKLPKQNQLPAGFPIGGKMAQILRSLDSHSETLRLLQIDIDEKVLKLSPNPKLNPALDRSITYPKLRCISIQFFTVFSWKSLMEELKEKFVNLEELTVLIHRSDTEGKPASIMYDFMTELWDSFGPSLKVIRVPFYGWNLRRGETPNLP